MTPRHLAIEGPIGVGKTTLARRLARHLDARQILEDESNPFLADFYGGVASAAFQCQAWFLLARFRQMRDLMQRDLFAQATVADYVFPKDRIFAYMNLGESDLDVYERLYAVLVEQLPRPDLVVYLQASDEILLERIRRRQRPVERSISPEYVSALNRAYNSYFFHYSETPLLVVNASSVDLATSEPEFQELLRQIEQLEGGTRYFVPAGTT